MCKEIKWKCKGFFISLCIRELKKKIFKMSIRKQSWYVIKKKYQISIKNELILNRRVNQTKIAVLKLRILIM